MRVSGGGVREAAATVAILLLQRVASCGRCGGVGGADGRGGDNSGGCA